MIKKILIGILVVIFASCNTTDGGRPYKSDIKIFNNPYITGEITNIGFRSIAGDSVFAILIEENPAVNEASEPEGKKISLSFWESTEIFILRENGNIYYCQKEDLKEGQKVKAWLMNGTILTSYPSQAGAKQILVFEE